MRWELVDKAEMESQEAESLSCPSIWLLSRCVLVDCCDGLKPGFVLLSTSLVNQSNMCIVWLCWAVSFQFLCLYLILEAVERWMPFSSGNCVFSCFWSDREWGKSYVIYLPVLYSGKLVWSSQHLDLFCLLFWPGPLLKFLLPPFYFF